MGFFFFPFLGCRRSAASVKNGRQINVSSIKKKKKNPLSFFYSLSMAVREVRKSSIFDFFASLRLIKGTLR